MARGRMIDQRFVQSEKLRSVSRDARLAYASILPFLDRDGRTNAEPIVLKANIFRRTDFELDEIALILAELHTVGLVALYADEDNEAILEFTGFLTFNNPNRNEKKSEFPGPDDPDAQEVREQSIRAALALHMQSAAERETPSTTAPLQRTDDARATHVQGTETASAMPRLNVNENVNVNENGNTHTSTETPASEPSAEHVELTARRERIPYQQFLDTWNQHRGPLPAAEVLNPKRRRAIGALIKEHGPDEALELLRDATTEVAGDEFYIQRQYGLDVLLAGKVLQRAEKFRNHRGMSEGDRKLAATAMGVAKAIGGME